jgi:hypothetical protein
VSTAGSAGAITCSQSPLVPVAAIAAFNPRNVVYTRISCLARALTAARKRDELRYGHSSGHASRLTDRASWHASDRSLRTRFDVGMRLPARR